MLKYQKPNIKTSAFNEILLFAYMKIYLFKQEVKSNKY